ncbi:MAG: MFS transporter [Cereibacter changlensis]|uniref:MFS transporter n=1 Tax=Cereibacter changlensis TaxID=402884 RepID=A0A4V5NP74_9RHOB|nr:MFS transporter [Cereibacter changlensis]TKA97597.1 MFS transporter [Cereibacter changlensis]
MATRNIPIFLKHTPTPRVESFALLAGLEAAVRGILISVMPLTIYDAVRDAGVVSRIYFLVGIASLLWGLLVPWATRHVPRRWLYTLGTGLYLVGMTLAVIGGPITVPLALLANALATVTIFVCFNAYVLDYIARADLGRCQSMQMLYAAAPWALGPMLGVWLRSLWQPAPFLIAAVFSVALCIAFWILRLGNGKQITRAKGPALNPLAYLGRFFSQPRLIAGWLFAVIRSCGWWVYVVYLPIYCIESGLGDKVGGVALSLSNALLFTTPFLLRFVYRRTVRIAVRSAFALCAMAFIGATLASGLPWVTVLLLMVGSTSLVLLDVAGGLPFMMAVKPSERTEMAAVYSSFRDVSGILTPGAAYLVLLAAPLAGVFAACGLGMAAAWVMAGRLHPRLGTARPSRGGQPLPKAA